MVSTAAILFDNLEERISHAQSLTEAASSISIATCLFTIQSSLVITKPNPTQEYLHYIEYSL